MDLDTTLTKHSHEKFLRHLRQGGGYSDRDADDCQGGHDYPNVTLVGIMAADLSLNADSFTAAETGFRLMLQAAGRAGRRMTEDACFSRPISHSTMRCSMPRSRIMKAFMRKKCLCGR